MTEERIKTDPAQPVVVNVHKQRTDDLGRRRNGVTLAAVGTAIGLVVGVIGFFSTYVFVTKAELSAHEKASDGSLYDIQRDQAITEASIKQIHERVRDLSEAQRDLRLEQRVTNRNLEKLLRRSRIRPAKRSDLEREDDE